MSHDLLAGAISGLEGLNVEQVDPRVELMAKVEWDHERDIREQPWVEARPDAKARIRRRMTAILLALDEYDETAPWKREPPKISRKPYWPAKEPNVTTEQTGS